MCHFTLLPGNLDIFGVSVEYGTGCYIRDTMYTVLRASFVEICKSHATYFFLSCCIKGFGT